MNSANTPELRTAPKIWICVDPTARTITSTRDLMFDKDNTTVRDYNDDDFVDQLTAAAIEERLK